MLYNKRQFRKANDKKVLRKVGKQWKTVSLALLMAIGGIGIATHVSHASSVNNNQNVNSTNTLRERLNSSLQKSSTPQTHQSNAQRQTNAATAYHNPQGASQAITNQANILHNRILQNAAQSHQDRTKDVNPQQNTNVKPSDQAATDNGRKNSNLTSDVSTTRLLKTGDQTNSSKQMIIPNASQFGDQIVNNSFDGIPLGNSTVLQSDDNVRTVASELIQNKAWDNNTGTYNKNINFTDPGTVFTIAEANPSGNVTGSSDYFNGPILPDVYGGKSPNYNGSNANEVGYVFDTVKSNPGTSVVAQPIGIMLATGSESNGSYNNAYYPFKKLPSLVTINGNSTFTQGNLTQQVPQEGWISRVGGQYLHIKHATVNYTFDGDQIGTQSFSFPVVGNANSTQISAQDLITPDNTIVDPGADIEYDLHDGQTINVPVDKKTTVNYYFGNQSIGTGNIYYSHLGNYAVRYGDQILGGKYEIDPRGGQNIYINPTNDQVTDKVQVDKTGTWGNVTWDLTPSDSNTDITNKYGKGNLYIHRGPIDGSTSLATALNDSSNGSNANNVQSIAFSDAQMPSSNTDPFSSLPNLTSFSANGLDTSAASSFQNWFQNDPKLSDLDLTGMDTSNANNMSGMFQSDSNLSKLTLPSTFNTTGATGNMSNMFANDTKLGTLKLNSSNTKLANSANLPGTWYQHNDSSNYTSPNSTNLMDNQSHVDPQLNNTGTFTTTPKGKASDIFVNYINETGHNNENGEKNPDDTLAEDDISGVRENGNTVDVFNTPDKNNNYGNPDPNDYYVRGTDGSNPLNYDSLRKYYTFNSNQQVVTVPLKGYNNVNSDNSDALNVNLYSVDHDGTTGEITNQKLLENKKIYLNGKTKINGDSLNGQIGNYVFLKPSDFLKDTQLNGNAAAGKGKYVVDPSNGNLQYYLKGDNDKNHQKYATIYSVKSDGHTIGNKVANGTVNIYYETNPNYNQDAGSITLKYMDGKDQIGSNHTIQPAPSDYGKTIDVTNPGKITTNASNNTGESIPAGYHLASDQNTDSTITNSNQSDVIQVRGNEKQTNDSNPSDALHVTVHVIHNNSNGTKLSDRYYKADGTYRNNDFNQTPKLNGNVGKSFNIDSSQFEPNFDASKYTVNGSDTSYNVAFNGNNHGITVKNNNTGSTVNSPGSGDGITFTYNVYDNAPTYYTNTVHYVSFSDIDNRGDITSQVVNGQRNDNFLTTVSDRGTANDSFDDKKFYHENIPQGWQFYRVYSVNGNKNAMGDNSGLNNFGGNGKTKQNQNEVIEVIPNADKIRFHYIDQDTGKDVKDFSDSGNGPVTTNGNGIDKSTKNLASDHTSKFGNQVSTTSINTPATSGNQYNSDQLGMPRGYKYGGLTDQNGDPINEASPTFNRNVQDVDIPVVGDSYPVNVKIHQHMVDANGDSHDDNISVPLNNPIVGHKYTIYGFQHVPSSQINGSSYTIDTSGHPFKITVQVDPDGGYTYISDSTDPNGGNAQQQSGTQIPNNTEVHVNPANGDPTDSNSNNEATFWYKISNSVSKPLTLIYVNQAGQKVGYSDQIRGTIGSTVNVTDPSVGGEPIPTGYTLTGPNGSSDGAAGANGAATSNITGKDQDTVYQLASASDTVVLHVTGNQENSVPVTVYSVVKGSDGHVKVDQTSENISGRMGDSVEVNPSDYNPDNNKYQVNQFEDGTQFIKITNSPYSAAQAIANPNRVVFYYDSKSTNGGAMTVRYINENTGAPVGDPFIMSGDVGTNADVTNSSAHGEAVPAGYTIDANKLPSGNKGTGTNPKYQFTNSPQNLNLYVKGQSVKNLTGKDYLTFDLHVIKEQPNTDGKVQSSDISDVPIHVNGKVGDRFTISPYGFSDGDKQIINRIGNGDSFSTPAGYHATNQDDDLTVTITSNGTLSTNSAYYAYTQNYVPATVGTVTVHYVTSDTLPNGVGDGHSPVSLSLHSGNGSGTSKSYNEIDEESDRGIVPDPSAIQPSVKSGNVFDLTPYTDDLPETVSNDFALMDSHHPAYDKNGKLINYSGNNSIASQNGTINTQNGYRWNFAKGNTDVYVIVQKHTEPNGNTPIIID